MIGCTHEQAPANRDRKIRQRGHALASVRLENKRAYSNRPTEWPDKKSKYTDFSHKCVKY